MNWIKFFGGLLGTIFLSVVLYFLLLSTTQILPYWDMLWWTNSFHTILCIVIFFLASFKNPIKNHFLNIVVINILTKMIGLVALVAIYVKLIVPTDNFFIIPFIISYLVFIVYETYFTSVQARSIK